MYVNLIVIDLYDYNVILGMDFLGKYNAVIDSQRRTVTFKPIGGEEFIFRGSTTKQLKMFISALKVRKLLAEGCIVFLANMVDKTQETQNRPKEVPIVKEFIEVFPEDLPGLPPEREISFEIELLPGSAPVSEAPYRMAPAELKELQILLQELLDR